MRIPIGDQIANTREAGADRSFRHHFAIHAHSFPKGNGVSGGEESGAITLRAADRIDHRADGAFAVCARDMDHTQGRASFRRGARNSTRGARTRAGRLCAPRTEIELSDESTDVLQSELDPEALKAVEPGER